MAYDFDKIVDRRGSGCFKYDALKALYSRDDLLSLWVADMDFEAAPCIQRAMKLRLEHGVFGYNLRMPDYYAAVSYWVKKRYGWHVKRDWIVNTPGVVPAINLAVLSLTRPDDKILIQTPVYRPFFNAVTDHDRCLLTNPLKLVNGKYQIDQEDFERKIRQASLFILCNPHNPVGRVWDEYELQFMGDLCKRYDVPIVSDEIHADIIYEGKEFRGLGSLERYLDLTITCISPAKSFNIAGLSSAVAIIPNHRMRKSVNDLNEHLHLYMGNSFGIEALKAAYSEGEDWLEELLAYLENNRNYLMDYISTNLPMLKMIKPESTYLAWLDFGELGLDDNALFDFLTNKARLALDPGRKYGVDGSGFSRLNFGCSKALLVEAMQRLSDAVKEGF
ncbi:MAG: PatB family C-S lyase [Candidatus Cloacimonetes bacterium]|nr:PatB family C-S lyase [Candidatus Cloacimonadota bacterium]